MYVSFFGLKELPFQITPDTRFFFGQGPHKKALAYASYGLSKGEGFVVITGEVGAGKTTLVNYFLTRLINSRRRTAQIVSSKLEEASLLRVVASEFGISCETDDKANLLRKIQLFLQEEEGRDACGLLVVDEAQNLSASSLEELRMLSNFQRNDGALLQIFLVGQPEFRDILLQPNMEQLRQRVVASFHLGSLDQSQTREYIEHRLNTVGWSEDPRIHPFAFQEVFRSSEGIPRRINLICDRLLVSAFLAQKHEIVLDDVHEVVEEIRQEGLLADADAPAPPAPEVAEFQAPTAVQPVVAPVERAPEPVVQDRRIAKNLLTIARRLQQIDKQMQEQERRLEQILAGDEVALRNVGKG